MADRLTGPQRRVLEFLAEQPAGRSVAPRQVARHLWPDSPAWQQRTRQFGGNRNGAVGGTMPMNAAQILWRLHDRGLAFRVGASYDSLANLWEITETGRRALA